MQRPQIPPNLTFYMTCHSIVMTFISPSFLALLAPRARDVDDIVEAMADIFDLSNDEKFAKVTVPADEVSKAIGRGGVNIRLASRLTECEIDVYREVVEDDEDVDLDDEDDPYDDFDEDDDDWDEEGNYDDDQHYEIETDDEDPLG